MPRRIQWRIAISYVALLTVAMLALGTYLVFYLRAQQFASLEAQLGREVLLVAAVAEKSLSAEGAGSLDALAKQMGRDAVLRVTLISLDGQVLGDSDADPATMENHAGRPEVIQALAQGAGEIQRHSATVDRDLLYLAVPMRVGGQIVGVARVALPISSIEANSNRVVTAVAAALAVAAAFGLLIAVVLARAIALPIQALTRSAVRLSEGQSHGNLPVDAGGEVGALAIAFNEMAGRIREHVRTVELERLRLATVLANIPDGVVILTSSGKIGLMNAAAGRLLNVNSSQAQGHTLIEVAKDHELADLAQQALTLAAPTAPRLIELGSGEVRRSIQAVATPVIGDAELGARALLVLQDVSDLRRIDAVRRDFVANVSHELRTPVASVKAMVETLEEGALEEPEVARDFLARIHVETDGLAHLIEELLELTRIESGRVQLRMEPNDVGQVVNGAVLRLQSTAQRQGVSLQVEWDARESFPARIDADRIQQVVMNLVHNAIKATPEGGVIQVSVERKGREAWIRVCDTGVGIDPAELSRLFERFYKVDKSRSSGGTGLGLAIAKHLTQAHGGRIWADSAGRGLGAAFIIALPLANSSNGSASHSLSPEHEISLPLRSTSPDFER